MPYIPFTDEQKVMANSVDLEYFLRSRGETLEKVGREYKLIYTDGSGRHDSITMSGSTWFDHTRAILHDSPVCIFDEATSNIDVESEEIILSEIQKLAKNKTIIMISHRLANVVNADCIYCLESGNIAESGTHEELLNNHSVYAKLWKTQAELESYGKEARA